MSVSGLGRLGKTVILPGIKSTLDRTDLQLVNGTYNRTAQLSCHQDPESEAGILLR